VKKIYGDVVLITGASSGIGRALAYSLSSKGFKVYGTSRKAALEFENDVATTYEAGGFFKMLQLDVCCEESVRNTINYIKDREGRIDILINNAGFGIAGSVEDTSPLEALSQMDTNFFGTHRMCRGVLPIMRGQGKGLIINISSVAGLISIPYQSMYSASKYAIEALTEAMRLELKPFGIKVSMVEPGDTKTNFTDKRIYSKDSANSVYKDYFKKSISTMEKDERNGPGPQKIVDAVIKIINSKNPPIRVIPGLSYKVITLLKKLLPSRLVEFVLGKIY
jgi:short-subunit dehydrogenase